VEKPDLRKWMECTTATKWIQNEHKHYNN